MNSPASPKSRRNRHLLAVLALLLPAAIWVTAQEAAKEIVKEIKIRYIGPVNVDESRIRANLATKVGDEFSVAVVSADIDNLVDSGEVDTVRALREDVAGGVRVIFEVQTAGVLGDIVIRGATDFKQDRLLKELEFEVGDPVEGDQIADGQRALTEFYRKRGFADAVIDYEVQDMGRDGLQRVVYSVSEGGKSVLNDIEFDGNTVFSDRQLRGKMKVKEHGFLSFITGSGKIDSVKLDEDILTIERLYQDRGYIYARVVDVEKVRIDEKKVDLIFHIEEGQAFNVAATSIVGNEVMSIEQLMPLLVTQAGQTYSASNIEKDEKTLRDFYGSQGYADSRVDVSITEAGPDALNVIFEISEGEISYLGRLEFSGNDTTHDKVLRREFPIAPGDKMNRPALESGKRRLESLDYFETVDFTTAPSSIPGHKDVQITVKEKSTGSINFGIGFSSIDDLVGFVDLTQKNFDLFDWPRFNGAGQKFRFGLKIGTERRDVIVSLTEPYMFGRRLSGTVEGYYRDLLFLSDFYDQTEYGAKFSLRKALGDNAFVRVGYTIQNIDIQVDSDASETIMREEGEYLQSEINLALVHDTRDSIFLPRRGHRFEVGGRYSGEFLGGDVDLWGVHASAVQHVSLPFDTIFTLKGRIDVVESTGDDEFVPIFDRQFLGGLRDLRGYEYRDAGPKDENGEPIGGQTAAYATAEYTFPIMKKVRGAIFGDIGVVGEDAFDFGGDVFSDVGVGIRVYTGLGLISIDVAQPLETDEFTDDELQFQFRMGYDFEP